MIIATITVTLTTITIDYLLNHHYYFKYSYHWYYCYSYYTITIATTTFIINIQHGLRYLQKGMARANLQVIWGFPGNNSSSGSFLWVIAILLLLLRLGQSDCHGPELSEVATLLASVILVSDKCSSNPFPMALWSGQTTPQPWNIMFYIEGTVSNVISSTAMGPLMSD